MRSGRKTCVLHGRGSRSLCPQPLSLWGTLLRASSRSLLGRVVSLSCSRTVRRAHFQPQSSLTPWLADPPGPDPVSFQDDLPLPVPLPAPAGPPLPPRQALPFAGPEPRLCPFASLFVPFQPLSHPATPALPPLALLQAQLQVTASMRPPIRGPPSLFPLLWGLTWFLCQDTDRCLPSCRVGRVWGSFSP